MDLEATPEERIQLEYATQHFGFTPDSFVETITTTAVEKINEDLDVSTIWPCILIQCSSVEQLAAQQCSI